MSEKIINTANNEMYNLNYVLTQIEKLQEQLLNIKETVDSISVLPDKNYSGENE